ncbi:MAG: hypothetical protein CSA31_01705 [Desulfobulbus propionicus]|nr:MAG: hypothetical protein CSA31_01705 [Desulfobulbus propionicus]
MDKRKNSFFFRNAGAVATVEFFWGLGFPIVLESTFLQLFLKELGASDLVVGTIPALFVFCSSCFPIFAGYLTRNIRFKKKIVMLVHIIPGTVIFLLGCTMLAVDERNILPVFFFFYTIFSITLGFAVPIWLNFLTRIFSQARAVPGLGYMMLAQNTAKIISSLFLLKIVSQYAFSAVSCAMVFLMTGTVFIVGALFFLVTREFEERDDPLPSQSSFLTHTREALKEILANKPFLVFLIADLDYYIIITTLSFYANYATQYYGVSQAVAAGFFVSCIYSGSITVNILLGTLDLLGLKQKFILSKYLTFMALLLLITVPGIWSFFLISFLLGTTRAIRNVVYTPSIKLFSGKSDATDYFALAPLLTAPIAFGFPLLFGRFLDLTSTMGPSSYKILFGSSAVLLLVTFAFTLKTRYHTPVPSLSKQERRGATN